MKTLQNNFTTVEQSKRLLELGVPAWTADCFRWDYRNSFGISDDNRYSTSISVICFGYQRNSNDKLPCWSVGRLIEIMKICNHADDVDEVFCELAYSKKNLVELIIRLMEENKEITDFSKLEE